MRQIRVEAVTDDVCESCLADDEEHMVDLINERIDDIIKGDIDSFSVVWEED